LGSPPDDSPAGNDDPDAPERLIRFRRLKDGTVVATCRGMAGVGRTQDEALMDLGSKLFDTDPDE